ncbi:MAG: transglycosylase domain-containing protein [Solobacterium sp.]|nr:transglycosylase domain-containing protein [Solobacterium sp.]
MKKLIGFLLKVILCLALLAGFTIVLPGYIHYRNTVDEVPLEKAAQVYFDMEDYVQYAVLDEDLVDAVVAVEDQRFFTRRGMDVRALIRAILHNLQAGESIEGGSTISQQIAKNLYYQTIHRTTAVKAAEIFIMIELEEKYSKEDLLALYMNMNYYGDGFWGISQASKGYFGAVPSDLTVAQSAMLAGIPNAPSAYQLSTGSELAVSRQRKVLSRMYEEEYITQEEYENALAEDVLSYYLH